MVLHHNQTEFKKLISRISEQKKFEKAIIEKDYYVTMFLQRLNVNMSNMVFKGGI